MPTLPPPQPGQSLTERAGQPGRIAAVALGDLQDHWPQNFL
jgi:hypothetical protein